MDELEPRFGPGRILRPYRDVRFSKDKSPYRTSHGAMIGDVYVQVSARGLGTGGGNYHLAPDQLERYRAAVAADDTGGELVRRIAAIEAAGIDVAGADALKTAPRGYRRPSPDRAAALPGPDRVAPVARRRVGVDGCREGSHRRVARHLGAATGVARRPRSGRARRVAGAGGGRAGLSRSQSGSPNQVVANRSAVTTVRTMAIPVE